MAEETINNEFAKIPRLIIPFVGDSRYLLDEVKEAVFGMGPIQTVVMNKGSMIRYTSLFV